ncbi:hypothetical protein L6452_10264 [Arctium lappa]|uniref:Uncharacterized protein n=1 Tax=Arctium lappa TaxID=4217 RepID=A0ACB9DLY4_ARCLA|nr:hypothetical protein L6452_10264 [Arctium lappa]
MLSNSFTVRCLCWTSHATILLYINFDATTDHLFGFETGILQVFNINKDSKTEMVISLTPNTALITAVRWWLAESTTTEPPPEVRSSSMYLYNPVIWDKPLQMAWMLLLLLLLLFFDLVEQFFDLKSSGLWSAGQANGFSMLNFEAPAIFLGG